MAYTGKILKINLSTGKSKAEPLNRKWAEYYLGGKGLAIKYLYEEITPGVDPLSPDNKLILMTGPLTGTIVPNSGKLSIAAKSPATNTVLDCSIGGHFASELKYAGYDAVIITGKAKVPVYIYIEDDRVELKSAAHLWGKNAHQAELILGEELDDAKTILIGQAGENQVIMSCITSEFYRQAGRGGIGAVMGSKNLKAVAVKGSGGLKHPDIRKLMREINKIKNEDTLTDDNLWAYSDGTAQLVEACQSIGTLPTHNFQDGMFEGFEQIGTDALKTVRAGKKACFSCPLACGNYSKAGEAIVEGPEYETLALCGSNCGIDDLAAVIEFNRLCDDYCLDTISAGNVTAFAMELTEKGIHDFGLRFGDKEAYLKVPRLIALRKGIGADLALGVRAVSEKYGGKEFAMQTKGLEFPGYEPRGSW
ncbi:MAG TPA: aldehyde ferredoxin oxidoreductase, partial [Firmicutes bacterium]|nr:aldehyde ferredoxin oxidoreductase [Bacillota bacterium]